jgi:K+-sensing histidine kinase KdpD
MASDRRDQVWIPVGIIGAVALGMALVPLRGLTSASNLAFAFVAFVIAVAEFGGRAAALTAAVVSAMSLNFFLTEPYLTLTMSKTDDVVAFFGMAACGLIAAAFGTRREQSTAAASRVREDLLALQRVLKPLERGDGLTAALDELRRGFGLARAVLRGADDRVLAVAPTGAEPAARAAVELDPETLFALDEGRYRFGDRGLRLPEGGGSLRLATRAGPVALHVWEGDAHGFDQDARQALAIAASALGVAASR